MQFWQTALHDYSEGARRLTIAFGAIAPVGLNGKDASPARDYISFPETKAGSEDAPKRERRACSQPRIKVFENVLGQGAGVGAARDRHNIPVGTGIDAQFLLDQGQMRIMRAEQAGHQAVVLEG